MPRWLVCALAAGCAWPAIVALSARGDVALAGPSAAAQALSVSAGLALVLAAASVRGLRVVRPRLLAAAGAAWLAAEWASPGAPDALLFTAGLAATGLALPLVLAATLPLTPRWAAAATLAAATAGGLLQGALPAIAADPRAVGCSDCPRDLLAAGADPDLADRLARAGAWVSIAACAAAVAIVVVTALRATPAARRLALPVTVPAAAFAVASAAALWVVLHVGSAAGGVRTAHLAAAAALVAIALGTQARLLLLRRARRAVTAATTAVAATDGEALSRILAPIVGDPSSAVLYTVPGVGWADAAGRPADMPAAGSGRRATLIEDRGEAVAALVHDERIAPDEDLLDAALAAGRLRLDTERLQAAALARVDALRAARRDVVDASEEERRRLERDLHDGAQQRLVALRFALGLAQARGGSADIAAADAALERALTELRELAHGLYPASLDSDGLATALATAAERSSLAVAVGELPGGRFATEVERTAYRVVADSLAVAERAGARAARIEAAVADGRLVVRIEHEGGEDGHPGELLDDRVQALAGRLRFTRTVDGALVVAELPCA
jgi:signal transduction histidine kinase